MAIDMSNKISRRDFIKEMLTSGIAPTVIMPKAKDLNPSNYKKIGFFETRINDIPLAMFYDEVE